MLILHSAVPAFGTRSASPFATKAESLLRLSGLPFERRDVSPVTGPRKKVPYLELEDGTLVSDTRNIRRYLEEHGLCLAPFRHDTAVRRVVEEHLYFAQMHFRWAYHSSRVRDELFADVPGLIRPFVFAFVHRSVRSALWGQGFGRRPQDEMIQLVHDDLSALEGLLDGRPLYGGDELSLADVAVHGALSQVIPTTVDDPYVNAVRDHAILVDLYHRVDARIYGPKMALQEVV